MGMLKAMIIKACFTGHQNSQVIAILAMVMVNGH